MVNIIIIIMNELLQTLPTQNIILFQVPDPEAEKRRDERGSHARSCKIMRTVEDRTEQLFLCDRDWKKQMYM